MKFSVLAHYTFQLIILSSLLLELLYCVRQIVYPRLVITFWVVQEFSQDHPEVTILDPPTAIEQLRNRESMLKDVDAMKLSESWGKSYVHHYSLPNFFFM